MSVGCDPTSWTIMGWGSPCPSTDESEVGERGNALQWLECWTGNTKSWVLVPALPVPHCVTLGKSLYISYLQFFHLPHGGIHPSPIHFTELWVKFKYDKGPTSHINCGQFWRNIRVSLITQGVWGRAMPSYETNKIQVTRQTFKGFRLQLCHPYEEKWCFALWLPGEIIIITKIMSSVSTALFKVLSPLPF